MRYYDIDKLAPFYVMSDLGFTYITDTGMIEDYTKDGAVVLAGPFYTFDESLSALDKIDVEAKHIE